MVIGIIIVVVILLAIFVFETYNTLIKLRNIVKEAFSSMDIYLKKRWDLIPNLVETVKGYAAHETEVLEGVTKLRAGSYDSMNMEDKITANNELSKGITKLLAVSENYPELKANENFKNLSESLAKVEEDIANSRKYYNGSVRKYNNKVQMIPSNIVAAIFGFKTEKLFEITSEERENVKVQF